MLATSYGVIKLVHISLISSSLILFAVRGVLKVRQIDYRNLYPPLKWLPHVIDTFILLSGALLVTITHTPIFSGWLSLKLLFLLAYIISGSLTLKYAHSKTQIWGGIFVALSCAGIMIKIALTKTFY